MCGPQVQDSLEQSSRTREIPGRPRLLGIVDPLGAVIGELPARAIGALARFAALCLRALFRRSAHQRNLIRAGALAGERQSRRPFGLSSFTI